MSIEEKKASVVITGATSGIGLAVARSLASRGFWVIGVGRSVERCRAAEREITADFPGACVRYLTADLSLQRDVRNLTLEIEALRAALGMQHLDRLINNAATVSSWHTTTAEGFETQLAVNHLAPFLLTHELLPLLKKAPEARIITVTSGSHRGGRIWWKDPNLRRGYSLLRAYRQSKLANVLFTYELARLLGPGSSIRAFAADPGLVNTGLGMKGTHGLAHWVWSRRRHHGVTPEQASATIVHLATAPEETLGSDAYWTDSRPVRSSRLSYDLKAARGLWELSERMCGIQWGADRKAA